MFKHAIIALAAVIGLTVSAQAQNPTAQAYKSPADCIADYGRLDTNQDGNIDANESSQYTFIREDVDVNGDGVISAEERRVSCEKGIARAFAPETR